METKKEKLNLRKEIKEKTVGYILGALGFVAGLAWNEAIKGFIDQFFPDTNNSVILKFLYAIIVTILIVVVTIYLLRLTQQKDDQ